MTMPVFEVCYETWQAGKHYAKGDSVELKEAPVGGWCKLPDAKKPKKPETEERYK